jgi:DNA-binding transcriptional ArsR family regulator
MADLLPSIPDTSAAEDAEPRVVGLESDDADDLLAALSSTTARELFAELNEEPNTPSALADQVDTTLQNAQYHLEKLEDADLIEVVDTAYSEKGREMDVYAPQDKPLVVFAGSEDESSTLRTALSRLLGGIGVLAVASLIVDRLVDSPLSGGAGAGGDDGAAGGPEPLDEESADGGDGAQAHTDNASGSNTTDSDGTDGSGRSGGEADDPGDLLFEIPGTDEAIGLPPGLLFFAGGALVLAVTFAMWYWQANR